MLAFTVLEVVVVVAGAALAFLRLVGLFEPERALVAFCFFFVVVLTVGCVVVAGFFGEGERGAGGGCFFGEGERGVAGFSLAGDTKRY